MRGDVNDSERTATPGRARLVGHVAENRAGALYVGRSNTREGRVGSIFANPFTLIEYGRAQALRLYLEHALGSGAILHGLPDLRGKMLDCWCRRSDAVRTPGNMCHADVLVAILDRLSDTEIASLRHETAMGIYASVGGSSLSITFAPELAADIRRDLGI
jgi:hypothetical protein